jgi:hypothetical protein
MHVLQISASNNVSTIIGNIIFLVILLVAIINFFTAYYSFNLSRFLVDRVQKSRAIWTGSLSILLSTTLLSFILLPETGPYSSLFVVPLIAFLLVLAALIDSTTRVAIDQDYFHRNTLYWNKLRFLYWAGILIIFVADPIFVVFGFGLSNFSNGYGLVLAFVLGGAPLAYGITTLLVSGNRSQDRKMRSYLRWLGLAAVALLGAVSAGNIPFVGGGVFVLFAVVAYFLYRAAKSLAPTNRFSKEIGGMKSHER